MWLIKCENNEVIFLYYTLMSNCLIVGADKNGTNF